jgi:hypothetical protein
MLGAELSDGLTLQPSYRVSQAVAREALVQLQGRHPELKHILFTIEIAVAYCALGAAEGWLLRPAVVNR